MSVSFCVGTGRCGTTFLSQVAGEESTVASSHERLRLAATFHMFCKWNDIPIDPEGFLVDREAAVREDLAQRAVSFESSALLSHSIHELYERFGARFLLLVRSPDQTVASFAVRRWFLSPIARSSPDLPPSYREGEEPRHFFGRNLPRGSEFTRWSMLTQIGKLSWFWAARNRAILDQLAALPEEHRRVERLEDLSYARYQEVARFLGWQPSVSEERFTSLARSRPNAGPNLPRLPSEWSALERAELEAETGPLARALGYEPSVEHILASGSSLALREARLEVREILSRLA